MLLSERPTHTSPFQPIHQQVQVVFNYDVHFTTGLFEVQNSLLVNVLAADEEQCPKRVIAIVDSGLLAKHPHLIQQIKSYTNSYANVLKLSDDLIIVSGGESAKNDPSLAETIH